MVLPVLLPLLCALTPTVETQFAASAAPTRFSATNPNPYPVLLLLGDQAHGARAQMLIAPGAFFETTFPSGTLDDLYMEVVCYSPSGRTASGAVNFNTLLAPGALALAVELVNNTSQPWVLTTSGKFNADSGIDFAPPGFVSQSSSSSTQLLDPTHIPVITPEDVDTDNVAPKIQISNPPI